ncbi:MAG: M23 family metallopeptidase [Deltaproteobacteria bacterium]|nr:M23 family metallopeptidase [Deltaproteobacteria bacterium]
MRTQLDLRAIGLCVASAALLVACAQLEGDALETPLGKGEAVPTISGKLLCGAGISTQADHDLAALLPELGPSHPAWIQLRGYDIHGNALALRLRVYEQTAEGGKTALDHAEREVNGTLLPEGSASRFSATVSCHGEYRGIAYYQLRLGQQGQAVSEARRMLCVNGKPVLPISFLPRKMQPLLSSVRAGSIVIDAYDGSGHPVPIGAQLTNLRDAKQTTDALAVGSANDQRIAPQTADSDLLVDIQCPANYQGLVFVRAFVELLDRPLLWPVAHPQLISAYGIYRPKFGRWHWGLDITSQDGVYVPIYPVANGIIESIGWGGGYGWRVVVRHEKEEALRFDVSYYGHMLKFASGLRVGDVVIAGKTMLGKMGKSGEVTGVHVHVDLRDSSKAEAAAARDRYVNPSALLPPRDEAQGD